MNVYRFMLIGILCLHVGLIPWCYGVDDTHSAGARESLSLKECYEAAQKQSEALARKGEEIKLAEAIYKQAVAQIFPKIHIIGTSRFRDKPYSRSNFVPDEGGSSERRGVKDEYQASLNLQQPIFTGFREFYLAESAEADIRAGTFDKRRSEELLYLDVADLFNQIRLYEQDLNILGKTDGVLRDRGVLLKRFITLGRSRESELLAAEADLDDVNAQREAVSGVLGASREMMAFLIKVPAEEIRLRAENEEPIVLGVDSYLADAKERFDLRAAEERLTSTSKQVVAAERLRWPNLSLEGSYVPYDDPDYQREGEVFLKLDIPLYEGGNIDAQIEQQRAIHRASMLTLQESKRKAERDVRIAYNDLTASRAQVEKLKLLLGSARKSYESQRQDYELGVVTNLEVLTAIRDVQNTERRLINAETSMRTNIAQLRVAAGGVEW